MKNSALLFVLMSAIAFMLSSCATTEPTQNNVFNFEYEGEFYQIVGYQAKDSDNEGINEFVKRENGYIIFWYRDINQDGYLNAEILYGIGIERANQIYLAGIKAAQELGKLRDPVYERKYELEIGYVEYQVISLSVNSPNTYNLFIIRDHKENVYFTIRDMERNGILDDPIVDTHIRSKYQQWYTIVLQEGVDHGRINFDGQKYLVERKPDQLAAAD